MSGKKRGDVNFKVMSYITVISESLAIAWPYCIYKDKESLSYMITYRKIPKISPRAYIFQRPFLRDLFLEGLLFGGAYLMREICIS